ARTMQSLSADEFKRLRSEIELAEALNGRPSGWTRATMGYIAARSIAPNDPEPAKKAGEVAALYKEAIALDPFDDAVPREQAERLRALADAFSVEEISKLAVAARKAYDSRFADLLKAKDDALQLVRDSALALSEKRNEDALKAARAAVRRSPRLAE